VEFCVHRSDKTSVCSNFEYWVQMCVEYYVLCVILCGLVWGIFTKKSVCSIFFCASEFRAEYCVDCCVWGGFGW